MKNLHDWFDKLKAFFSLKMDLRFFTFGKLPITVTVDEDWWLIALALLLLHFLLLSVTQWWTHSEYFDHTRNIAWGGSDGLAQIGSTTHKDTSCVCTSNCLSSIWWHSSVTLTLWHTPLLHNTSLTVSPLKPFVHSVYDFKAEEGVCFSCKLHITPRVGVHQTRIGNKTGEIGNKEGCWDKCGLLRYLQWWNRDQINPKQYLHILSFMPSSTLCCHKHLQLSWHFIQQHSQITNNR